MTKNTISRMAAIAALIFGFGLASWAEQVTIGNLESASQNASLPFNGTFSYSYTQQIYTAEEIGGAGAINSLTVWLVHTGTEALPTFNIDIYMKEVSKDAFSGTTDWVSVSSTDKVYTGTLTVANTTARAFTFTLDRSFVYSGQNNLLIAFDDNTGSWKSGLRGMVFGTAGTPARSIYALNDNTNFDPTSMSGVTAYTTSYQRNVIELGIYDEDLSNIHNITIGDPQSTSQITSLPWVGIYDYSYTQQIYTADEIGTSGTINAVTMWLVHTGSDPLPTFNIDIYMKEVDKETFSGSSDWVSVSADDKVYSGSVKVTNTSAQAFTFTLATPFAYSGQSNLLIVFDDNTGTWKGGLRGMVFGSDGDPSRAVYACRDGSDYDPFNMGGVTSSTLTRRNVVALSMTDCPALPGLNTVTIGDTESTASHSVLPMTSTFNYSYTQQIFTAEEIGTACTVNTLTMWLRNNSTNILPTLVFDIYMREVDKDAFTGLTDWVSVSATDKVYSGTLTVTNRAFQSYTITLDIPFEYSGEGNLLIAFDENTGYWKSGLEGKVSGTEGDPIRTIYARRDGSDYDPLNISGVLASGTPYQRNVVEFGIVPPPTLTVYDGTETNNRVPAYVYFFDDFTRSQFVIPAADLTDMTGGTINGLKFYTNGVNIPYTTVSTVDVYLKEVDYTTLSAYEPKESATIVYQGLLDFELTNDGGELTINFNDDYAYNGGNLLVGIDNLTDAGYKNIIFYGQTVTGASGADSHFSSLEQVPFTQQDFIPKTTFAYTPGTPPPPPDPCLIAVTPNAPYIEDFESPDGVPINWAVGPVPDCWGQYTTGPALPHIANDWGGFEGAQCLSFYSQGDQYAILPKFSTATNLLKISFWKQYGNGLQLGYITAADNGACNTFTAVETYYGGGNAWTQHVTYLSDVPETAHRLVFKRPGGGSSCLIDYVEVTFFDGCYNVGTLSVSDLTSHSVHLSWDLIDDSQTEWNVQVATNADFTENLVEYLADSHEDYLLNNLDGRTIYYVRVGPTCSEYWWSNTVVFETQCDGPVAVTADAPYTQGFEEGWIPGCWNVYAPEGYDAPYVYKYPYSYSGSYSLMFEDTGYAVLPEFNVPLNLLQIRFWINGRGQLELGYITAEDDGTCNTFTAIADYTASSDWVQYTNYLLNVPATAHRLAFKAEPEDSLQVDDVEVSVIPLGFCSPVGNLGLGRVASNSAYLSWEVYDAEQTVWDVQVATDANFTENVANLVADSHENYLVEGLDPDTYYYVRVKPSCSDDLWSNTVQFLSMPPCDGPITVTADAPYTEGFENPEGTHENELGRLPACWESYTTGSVGPHNATPGSSWVHGGTQSLSFRSITRDDTYAILPEFSNSLNELQISFWLRCVNGRLQLGYLTAEDEGNCNTFTAIADFGATAWTQHTAYLLNVPEAAQRLAFKWSENDMACYIDDLEVSICTLDCFPVGALSVEGLSSTSAYLSWELFDDSQTAWNVQLATDAAFTNILVDEETDSHENYLLEGLSVATQYYVRVKPTCSDDLWNVLEFALPCAPITVTTAAPYTQGFETPVGTAYDASGPLPPCWDANTNAGYKPHNSFSWSHGGTQSLAFYNAGIGIAFAVLPEFSNPLNQLQISFWMRTYNNDGTLQLGYLTADDNGTGNSFTTIVTYNNNNGNYIQQSTVLENVPAEAERLAFKWSTTGTIYCYIDDVEVSINPNAIATQTTTLTAGWNWWSTYIDMENNDGLSQLTDCLGTNGLQIITTGGSLIYRGGSWIGSITSLSNTKAYKIKTNAPVTVTITGSQAVDPANCEIQIMNGWNWIAYPLSESKTVAEALAGFEPSNGDNIKTQGGSAVYRNGNWLPNTFTFEPGKGYTYKSMATQPKTLIFQTGSKAK